MMLPIPSNRVLFHDDSVYQSLVFRVRVDRSSDHYTDPLPFYAYLLVNSNFQWKIYFIDPVTHWRVDDGGKHWRNVGNLFNLFYTQLWLDLQPIARFRSKMGAFTFYPFSRLDVDEIAFRSGVVRDVNQFGHQTTGKANQPLHARQRPNDTWLYHHRTGERPGCPHCGNPDHVLYCPALSK
jgi:hypothetical protein